MVERTEPSLTVGIPTYGRPEYLRRALGYLAVAQEEAARNGLEATRVLVLVNGKPDGYEVLQRAFERFAWLEWRFDSEPGSSRARNTILADASTSHVALLDDESFVRSDWLIVARRIIRERSNDAAVGGPFHAFFEGTVPSWLPRNFASNGTERASGRVEILNGGNMIVEIRSALEIGGFSTGFGPIGSRRRRGGDTEFCFALGRAGHTLWFESDLVVDHAVKAFLMSRRGYLWERFTKELSHYQVFPNSEISRISAFGQCVRHSRSALQVAWRSSSETMFHLGKAAKFAGVLLGPPARPVGRRGGVPQG